MNTLEKLAEIRVMELRQYVLPSITKYLKESYEIDISIDELATEALNIPLVESKGDTKINTPISSPQRTLKGCQFPMKNSRTRPNMPCEKTANANKYFCKKCTEKATFSAVVREVSDTLGIPIEELTKGIGSASSKKKEDGITLRAPRVPEKRDKYTGAPEKPEKKDEEDELELSSIPDMLDCFCYDEKTSIAYYYDDNDLESDPVAFGVYKVKEDKIYRLSEQNKISLRKRGIEIGDYDNYELEGKEVKQ